MYKSLLVSFTAILLCAGVALAHGSGHSGPATKAIKIAVKGTSTSVSATLRCSGTGDSWVDDYSCSSSGNCSCNEVTPATISGSDLKTVTNFFVTADVGFNPATATPVSPGPSPQCDLFLGAFAITDGSGDTATVNFGGVSCEKLTGFSSKNPSGTEDQETLSGGWGISGTPPPSKALSGWGTFTGTHSDTSNEVSLKLSGWRTD